LIDRFALGWIDVAAAEATQLVVKLKIHKTNAFNRPATQINVVPHRDLMIALTGACDASELPAMMWLTGWWLVVHRWDRTDPSTIDIQYAAPIGQYQVCRATHTHTA
jgi:hypothetical protein